MRLVRSFLGSLRAGFVSMHCIAVGVWFVGRKLFEAVFILPFWPLRKGISIQHIKTILCNALAVH